MFNSDQTRRALLAGLAAAAALPWLSRPAAALTTAEARGLIDRVVGEINATINSGKSESAMYRDFERIFARYADVAVIARSVLGPAARTASRAELSAYTQAFQGYIARKYGKRFREFIGGRVEVKDARPVKTYHEVQATTILRGKAPFDVRFLVSDRSGRDLFFNLIVEGVNMLSTERAEVQAMLDRRRGDIGALTEDLKRAG